MQPRISKSKQIAAILSQHRSPSQIAMGITIGVVLGVIPKDNLIALTLVVALTALRVNQLAACIAAATLTLFQPWFSPVAHSAGLMLLQQSWMVGMLRQAYTLPILPWTCLENTVVAGGLLLGSISALPTYLACRWIAIRTHQQLESLELRQIANEAIRYRKVVTEQAEFRKQGELVSVETQGAMLRLVSDSREQVYADIASVPLQPSREEIEFDTSTNVKRDSRNKKASSLVVVMESDSTQDTILRETVIEVVRYRRQPVEVTVNKMAPHGQHMIAGTNSQNSGDPMSSVNATIASSQASKAPSTDFVVTKQSVPGTNSITIEPGHSSVQPTNREESLKYLLSHINSSRDSQRKSSGKST
jgi:uncharacterized protein (TIGR03546 family)